MRCNNPILSVGDVWGDSKRVATKDEKGGDQNEGQQIGTVASCCFRKDQAVSVAAQTIAR
jgi:hypothetical protein